MAELSQLNDGGRVAGMWLQCRHGKTFASLQAEERLGSSLQIWPDVETESLPFAITAGLDGEVTFQFPGPKGDRKNVRLYTAPELVAIFDKVEELEAKLTEYEPFLKKLERFLS